jgi:mRNA degradation ribonuclease J1/J2
MSLRSNKTSISKVLSSFSILLETKEQLEYLRLHKEFQFVKKRSLVNFLTNEKLNVEQHFHDRALNMLKTISNFEENNLNLKLKSITNEALDATMNAI